MHISVPVCPPDSGHQSRRALRPRVPCPCAVGTGGHGVMASVRVRDHCTGTPRRQPSQPFAAIPGMRRADVGVVSCHRSPCLHLGASRSGEGCSAVCSAPCRAVSPEPCTGREHSLHCTASRPRATSHQKNHIRFALRAPFSSRVRWLVGANYRWPKKARGP
jgi:hypothetical protein